MTPLESILLLLLVWTAAVVAVGVGHYRKQVKLIRRLQEINSGLVERVAKQSELLSKKAEKTVVPERTKRDMDKLAAFGWEYMGAVLSRDDKPGDLQHGLMFGLKGGATFFYNLDTRDRLPCGSDSA